MKCSEHCAAHVYTSLTTTGICSTVAAMIFTLENAKGTNATEVSMQHEGKQEVFKPAQDCEQ